VKNDDGTPDGGVQICSRSPAARTRPDACSRSTDFERELARRKVIRPNSHPRCRAGLIEQIPDKAKIPPHLSPPPPFANQANDRPGRSSSGYAARANIRSRGHAISGQATTNGNDGTNRSRASEGRAQKQNRCCVLRRGVQRGDGHHQRAV